MELAPESLPEDQCATDCEETLPAGESNCTPPEVRIEPGHITYDPNLIPLEPAEKESEPISLEEKRAMVQNALDQILGDKYLVTFYDEGRGLHTLSGRNLSDMELCYMADTINEHRRV